VVSTITANRQEFAVRGKDQLLRGKIKCKEQEKKGNSRRLRIGRKVGKKKQLRKVKNFFNFCQN